VGRRWPATSASTRIGTGRVSRVSPFWRETPERSLFVRYREPRAENELSKGRIKSKGVTFTNQSTKLKNFISENPMGVFFQEYSSNILHDVSLISAHDFISHAMSGENRHLV
jgi:hypothetical protein